MINGSTNLLKDKMLGTEKIDRPWCMRLKKVYGIMWVVNYNMTACFRCLSLPSCICYRPAMF